MNAVKDHQARTLPGGPFPYSKTNDDEMYFYMLNYLYTGLIHAHGLS